MSNAQPPINIQPDSPDSQKWAFVNQNFQSLANALNPLQISDGSNNRVLIGKDSTGSYVMKVSKANYNAFDASADNLIFNSGQDILKVVSTGTTSINANATAGIPIEVTIAHGLSFVPIPLVFMNNGGNYYPLPTYTGLGTSGGNIAFNNWIDCATTSSNLVISFTSGSTANWGTFTFKYYLLQESAA